MRSATEDVPVSEPCWRCGHDKVNIESVAGTHWDGVRFHCANSFCDNVSSVRPAYRAHMLWNRSSQQQRTKLGDRFGRIDGRHYKSAPPQPDAMVQEEFEDWFKMTFGRRPNLRVGSSDNRVFFAWVCGRSFERQWSGLEMKDRLNRTAEVLWSIRKP